MADPRWLEIIKASGGQAFALAGASAGFLLLARWGWLPPLEPWMIHAAVALLLLSSLLWMVSIVGAINKFFPVKRWVVHGIQLRRERQAAENYIPFMTNKEREILAYLLHHQQKMFTCATDGGHASTLISQGIVVRALRPGQVFTMDDMPVVIPDHIWDVLMKHKDAFPLNEDPDGPFPWRERLW